MSLENGKRSSFYNVFEMRSTSLEEQSQPPDHSESGTIDTVKKKKTARTRRISILLGVTALCLSIAFVATALVYYFQLRGEWKRETIDFKNEIKILKQMNSKKPNSSEVQKIAATSVDDSEQILSIKTQVEVLRASLNDSSALNAEAIQNLKQADYKYSKDFSQAIEIITQTETNLSAGIDELRKVDANGEISMLKSHIENMKGLWSGDSESLNEAVQNLQKVDTNHSKALLKESDKREKADHLQSRIIEENFLKHEREHLNDSLKFDEAIQEMKALGSNRSQTLTERLTDLRSKHLNYSRKLSHAIEIITQSELNLSAGISELKEAGESDAAKIYKLQSQVGDLKVLWNDSKSLNAAVQNLKEFNANYSKALHSESDKRIQADHLQSQIMEEKFLSHKQKHFNEVRKLNDTIRQLKEMGLNQSESLRKRVTEQRREYLNFSDSVNEDIQEIRQKTGKCLSALENEIRSRKSEDTKNSQNLANEMKTLNQVDAKLMNHVNALKQNDLNQTDAIQSVEKNCVTRSQRQYSSLSDKITNNWNADQTAFSKITTQLDDLKQANLSLSRQLTVGFANMQTTHSRRVDLLALKVQQLKDADSDRSQALLKESTERKRMNSTLVRQIQDGVNDMNRKQSLCRTQIDNLGVRIGRISARIEENPLSRNELNALIKSVHLLATGWKGATATLFYKKFFDVITFAAAVSKCRREGARIALKIWRNSDTVRELIRTGYISYTETVWMDISDIHREGSWRWSDGVTGLPAMIRWRSGEPNNGRNGEDCADGRVIDDVIKMNDLACSDRLSFICEKDVD